SGSTERTLSSDTEESFKSIPGSIRKSLRHIDLISTSIHLGSLDEIARDVGPAINDRNLFFIGRDRELTLSLDAMNYNRSTAWKSQYAVMGACSSRVGPREEQDF